MAMALPLHGLTIIELGTSVAAPYGGQVLAELGATVIKIENPQGGDDAPTTATNARLPSI
jgi:crotonobetainyl-CoA:carnitine CoA-transferase CaiB-like acyl-CoA transferase